MWLDSLQYQSVKFLWSIGISDVVKVPGSERKHASSAAK